MRIVQAILGLLVTGAVVMACTINENDCEKNPTLDCFKRITGSGGTAGGGGTGGAPCTGPSECPAPADQCREATCESGICGERDKPCGNLTCNTMTGMCEGCAAGDPNKMCPLKDCYEVACVEAKCMETVNGALPCNNGQGTCDDKGNCGKCGDGIQNGDETGLDCGPATCGRCNGEDCGVGGDCESGFCVDGVCCDGACDGLCQSCNQDGAVGTCSPVPVGTPDDTGANGKCGADAGGCGVTQGYCRCRDGVANGDETDVDCGGATCGRECGTGHVCIAATDCISGYCVDGYCCGSLCDAPCKACNLSGREGLCSPVDVGTADSQNCSSSQACSSAGTCAQAEGESCDNGSECASNRCSGNNGTCLVCGAGGVTCTGGKVCIGGACYGKAGQGEACPSNMVCDSGYCIDGVCCDTPCIGLCMACHVNYTGLDTGTCGPILAGYDPHSECPEPDPAQPGPGGSAYCSGMTIAGGDSFCAQP